MVNLWFFTFDGEYGMCAGRWVFVLCMESSWCGAIYW